MLRKRSFAIFLGGLLVLICLILSNSVLASPSETLQENNAAIELSELFYEENCTYLANTEWEFIHQPHDPILLKKWKEAADQFAEFKKAERQNVKLSESFNGSDVNNPLSYKYELIQHPGDAALNDTDYNKLVTFTGANRVIQLSGNYSNGSKNFSREEVESLLEHNGEEGEKLKAWNSWHQQYATQVGDYSSVLQLAEKAALANGKSNVQSYWEMLSGEPNAYDELKYQLSQLADLHSNLAEFTQQRLMKKYGIEMTNNTIPAHLLGSLAGNNWIPLAFDVIPDQKIIYEMRKNLWEKRMMGANLYKTASQLGKIFLGQIPSADFWSDSDFKGGCATRLVNFCLTGKMRVSTCNEPSLANYLTAHKNVAKVLLHQMTSSPIINDFNRFSVLEEAVAEFFSILAASPAWLKQVGILDKSVGTEEAKITSMTITALDVLPRISYYISADKWRLEAIENNETDPKLLTSEWWRHRMQNELVTSNTNDLPTFLDDEHIVSNKPYISKVLGILLAFQTYDKILKSTNIRDEPYDKKADFNPDFVRMARNSSDNWKTLITKFLGIESIRVNEMTAFFDELEYFFQSYDEPTDYDPKRIVELESLEAKYRKTANTPKTTTTTTTSSTTSTTTTTPNPVIRSNTPKEVKDITLHGNSILEADDDVMLDDEQSQETSYPKNKSDTAVWVVGGVLIATVIICIIAIFGRRKCSTAPKNRRYGV